MTDLDKLLTEIRKRLVRWHEELPKLIQPEKSVIRDRTDLERLLRIVDVQHEALNRANYQNDYYDLKPHKALEVVYGNREALVAADRIARGE